MCVAVPGKIISINDTVATVDFDGNKVCAELGLVNAKPGDYALVHAGCVIQILSEDDGIALSDLYKELNEAMKEDN